MSGWLVPPITGDYVFWIASDNNGELWLSSDDDPANKVVVCHVPGWASPREWDKYQEQKSEVILLVAGQAYYYKVRLIVFDYLSVIQNILKAIYFAFSLTHSRPL